MAKPRRVIDQDIVQDRLENYWGFGHFFAASYSWSIASGSVEEDSDQFKAIKNARRAHVMEIYKDMGGEKKIPSFKTNEIGKEAVRRADDQLRAAGWERDDATSYFVRYYYGIEKRSDWQMTQDSMKATWRAMRKSGKVRVKANI